MILYTCPKFVKKDTSETDSDKKDTDKGKTDKDALVVKRAYRGSGDLVPIFPCK